MNNHLTISTAHTRGAGRRMNLYHALYQSSPRRRGLRRPRRNTMTTTTDRKQRTIATGTVR